MRGTTTHSRAGVDSDRLSLRGRPDALHNSSSPGNYNGMEMGSNGTPGNHVDQNSKEMWEGLLVVATLLVAVTYQAGLSPPGGVWQEFPQPTGIAHPPVRHKPGYPILKDLPGDKTRYILFSVFNTIAFGYSLGTLVLLLLTIKKRPPKVAMMMRTTMVISLLFLGIAFCLGCSRNAVSTVIYISAAVPAFICTSVFMYYWPCKRGNRPVVSA